MISSDKEGKRQGDCQKNQGCLEVGDVRSQGDAFKGNECKQVQVKEAVVIIITVILPRKGGDVAILEKVIVIQRCSLDR